MLISTPGYGLNHTLFIVFTLFPLYHVQRLAHSHAHEIGYLHTLFHKQNQHFSILYALLEYTHTDNQNLKMSCTSYVNTLTKLIYTMDQSKRDVYTVHKNSNQA